MARNDEDGENTRHSPKNARGELADLTLLDKRSHPKISSRHTSRAVRLCSRTRSCRGIGREGMASVSLRTEFHLEGCGDKDLRGGSHPILPRGRTHPTQPSAAKNLGHTFADNQARGLAVAGGNHRHDRDVGDAHVPDLVDLRLGVHARKVVLSHLPRRPPKPPCEF